MAKTLQPRPILRALLIAGGLTLMLSSCHYHHGYYRGGFGYHGGHYGSGYGDKRYGYHSRRHSYHRRGHRHGGWRGRY